MSDDPAGARPLPSSERHPTPTVGLPANPDPDVPFWVPSWRERLSYLGWRWVYLIGSVTLSLALIVLVVIRPDALPLLGFLPFKLLLIGLVGIPTALAGRAMRHAMQQRPDPFCIHCGYGLSGLPEQYRCPECGRPYDLRLISDYRRDPYWFRKRWKANRGLPPADVPFAAGSAPRRRSRDGT